LYLILVFIGGGVLHRCEVSGELLSGRAAIEDGRPISLLIRRADRDAIGINGPNETYRPVSSRRAPYDRFQRAGTGNGAAKSESKGFVEQRNGRKTG
jgi:hypothetical protein